MLGKQACIEEEIARKNLEEEKAHTSERCFDSNGSIKGWIGPWGETEVFQYREIKMLI